MDYSAGGTSNRLWYVETKETARLLQVNTWEETREIVLSDNLYQQSKESRLTAEFLCIQRRLKALPEDLVKMLVKSDINTAKVITLIGCMASDLLFFEFMYEVFRQKLYMGDEMLTDADWNIFFKDKQEQSDKVAGFSDSTNERLRQAYFRTLFEAGMITDSKKDRKLVKPIIDPDLKYLLQRNAMEKYYLALTGER